MIEFFAIFVLAPAVVVALQWAARRYVGQPALVGLSLVLFGAPLWIAHWEIPASIRAAQSARTCFNCEMAVFAVPALWGFSALFAIAGLIIGLRPLPSITGSPSVRR
jgi:hypothetical protein